MRLSKLIALVSASLLAATSFWVMPASAATAESYDFNTTGQLASNFDLSSGSSGSYSQSTTGGIANSGAINAPGSLNAVFASKNSYTLGAVGSKYTFSSYIKSVGNSGYSGMGFSATPGTTGGTPYRPSDALGISVHGGGFVFHNGATNYSANWQDNLTSGSIRTVTAAGINDLLNSGSADQWYKIIFSIEVVTGSKFTMRVEVWPANGTTGALRNGTASAIFEVPDVSNAAITNAPTIKSYINFSGYRVTYFDNFEVDVPAAASVVSAGAPVVVTGSSSLASSQITVAGNVTSENGSAVNERGIVYGTSANPTTSDTKITSGTGTGTYSITTPTLSAGTYFARAYAINSTGTTYGAEVTHSITQAPTLTWAPSNTSAYVSAATLTPSALASTNSSGAVTYSVQSAGTTGCTVNSGTAVIAFTAAGTCVVRATVAASGSYSSATIDKSFTINANSAPDAPTSVTATAGNAVATVSWTAPATTGGSAVTSYTVTATPGGATCVASAPATTCDVTGLTNGTAYTFAVTATNNTGPSSASSSSASVTPAAPVVNSPAPSSGSSPVAPPAEKPTTKVSSVDVQAGKKPGTSVIKLKVEGKTGSPAGADIQIKLLDLFGKVIKVLTVPITTATDTVQVDLALPIGDFTVEASTANSAGVASDAVLPGAILVSKPNFTKVTIDKVPVLAGVKASSPVAFLPDSTKLSAAAKTQLIALATKLQTTTKKIAITGFSAGGVSTLSAAQKVANKRAMAVASYLKAQGFGGLIYYAGYGPITTKQAQGNPRKVEIRIIG
jgi:outer membrane protein OmpA-like peptidoglycan-associated protein